jgi:apolipoprotein N-acyltransferase
MSRRKPTPVIVGSCILTGILLWLSWPERGYTPVIFFALVPLLFAEYSFYYTHRRKKGWRMFGNFFLSFLIWNALTTWWIYNATDIGSFVAIGINSLFMATIWQLYFLVKRSQGPAIGYVSLVLLWVAFEYLHFNWEISWPWLTLGNVFAMHPEWVQWYEYTGVLGGTIWILAINLLIFQLVKNLWYKDLLLRIRKINVFLLSGLVFVLVAAPMIFSLHVYYEYEQKGSPAEVVVIQPNVDPYNEKFSGTGKEQLAKILRLALTTINPKTEYCIAPETALPDGLMEEELETDLAIHTIRRTILRYPRLNFITGLTSFKRYNEGDKISLTARKTHDGSSYYDVFNTAMLITGIDPVQLYHKSRLVPGVEKMPYPAIFGFLEAYAIKLGGTSGSLGTQTRRTNFIANDGTKIAPAICYESIYGGFESGFIRDTAEFIAVITNDGWWGDTPGYRQHMNYARLLAVEFRKDIARSANTGISCFINQRGDVVSKTGWWTEESLSGIVHKNKMITFYARHGDYLGFICAFLAATIVIYLFIKRIISTS